MNLNHLDLAVRDVTAAAGFFQTCFGMSLASARSGFALMIDKQGFALVLSELLPDESNAYPRGFHVGFNLGTSQEVLACYERVVAAGTPIVRTPGLLAGALSFQCQAPGGVVVEVAHRAA